MADLLLLAQRLPYPPNRGDRLRSYHVLRYLSQRYRVHLGCFVHDVAERKYYSQVAALCYETCFVDHKPMQARMRCLRALATDEPMSVAYHHSAKLEHWVQQLQLRHRIASALVLSSPMAQYLTHSALARRVIDFADVDSEKWRQDAADRLTPFYALHRREARHLLAFERSVASRFDYATFVSAPEAALFGRLAPETKHKLDYFNNGVDADYFSPHIVHRNPYCARLKVIVFTGAMNYLPNVDAVVWFAEQVFPALLADFPALRFYIVGACPTLAVRALARRPGIVVTGSIADTRPYLAHAALAVLPARSIGNMQSRVLEAMAMQKLVVASPQALEGMTARIDSELIVATKAEHFRRRISDALSGAGTRGIGMAARARVLKDYSWERNLARLSDILDSGGLTLEARSA